MVCAIQRARGQSMPVSSAPEHRAQDIDITLVNRMRSAVIAPLCLPPRLAQQIEQDAVRAYPDECCGILIGRDEADQRIVDEIRAAANVAGEGQQARRFSVDPRQIMLAEKDALATGRAVLGFYHSHPDHPARPSDFDREQAWPYYSYVIISIIGGEPVDMTSWVLDDQTRAFTRQAVIEEQQL